MRLHTPEFKENIKLFGRELNSKLSYTIDGVNYELGNEDLNSITPNFESSILKSAMRGLRIDSNVEIPEKTIINYQFGVKVREQEDLIDENDDGYDYINFGDYIIKSVEKQEDTNSYNIIAYDFMLNAMKDYTIPLDITYPISIRDYINTICERIGLEFKNINDEFVNYDKEILNELYIDIDGNSLGYTYRDILDELSAVTASIICIDIETNKLKIQYINNTEDIIDEEYLKDVNVKFGQKFGPLNTIVLTRSGDSDSIYKENEQSVALNGRHELQIKDNQIMNFNDRGDYAQAILNKLNGLEYFINDFQSTGICYYDVCDKYGIQIGEYVYPCIMFNNEINITQGLEESIYTDIPDETNLDYSKASKDDRMLNQVYVIADKVNKQVETFVGRLQTIESTSADNASKVATLETSVQTLQTDTYTKTEINQKLTDGSVTKVQTISGIFDENGMTYEKSNAPSKTTINETGVGTKRTDGSNDYILFAGYVDDNNSQYSDYKGQTIVATENLIVKKYLVVETHSRFENYENGTGCFYLN